MTTLIIGLNTNPNHWTLSQRKTPEASKCNSTLALGNYYWTKIWKTFTSPESRWGRTSENPGPKPRKYCAGRVSEKNGSRWIFGDCSSLRRLARNLQQSVSLSDSSWKCIRIAHDDKFLFSDLGLPRITSMKMKTRKRTTRPSARTLRKSKQEDICT